MIYNLLLDTSQFFFKIIIVTFFVVVEYEVENQIIKILKVNNVENVSITFLILSMKNLIDWKFFEDFYLLPIETGQDSFLSFKLFRRSKYQNKLNTAKFYKVTHQIFFNLQIKKITRYLKLFSL